ncbi:MAG TPA: LysM peptidoglycan-binding domain-containing protein [Thermoanaerobaculia bacterium]|nr:LysM peptidoglycan-binding domain-containing protein [Thermoanaerobaculia bacterium]
MKQLILLFFALCAFAAAAEDTIGWHVVKEGETLEKITRRYLGTSEGWRENWKLNPQLASPHRLLPGQRIRVILARTLPARFARIDRVSRHVERKPEPDPWTAAKAGDQLAERHGLQTYRASSAELRFEDDTQLTLTEESLIFLRSTKSAPKRDRTEIEIVDGNADLEKKRTAHAHDIEIIVGSVVAKPQDAAARARFRKDSGKGNVMSYRGGTSVASGGASVDVGEGMGVSVPEGQRPPKPEKLLPAPSIAAVDVATARPLLRWPAVAGASSYSVEICRDASCGAVVARAAGLAATEWQAPEAIGAGAMHWRVTARSASGLDGYPAVAPMNVLAERLEAVTTTADAGEGSLRQAVLNANALPGVHTIRFLGGAAGTIKLASPLPAITGAVTIEGAAGEVAEIGSSTNVGSRRTRLLNPKRAALTIDFNGAPVGFDAKGPLTLRNLAIGGAATQVRAAATLTVENVVIGTLLESAPETGIEAFGDVTVRRTLITGMRTAGIALRNNARLDAEHLEVSNSGDAIAIEGTGSRIRHALFYLNANAIAAASANVLEESTFRGNRTALSLMGAVPSDTGNVFEDNTLAAVRGGRVSRISVDSDGRTVVSGTAAAGSEIEIFTGALQRAAAGKAGADGTFDVVFVNFGSAGK